MLLFAIVDVSIHITKSTSNTVGQIIERKSKRNAQQRTEDIWHEWSIDNIKYKMKAANALPPDIVSNKRIFQRNKLQL